MPLPADLLSSMVRAAAAVAAMAPCLCLFNLQCHAARVSHDSDVEESAAGSHSLGAEAAVGVLTQGKAKIKEALGQWSTSSIPKHIHEASMEEALRLCVMQAAQRYELLVPDLPLQGLDLDNFTRGTLQQLISQRFDEEDQVKVSKGSRGWREYLGIKKSNVEDRAATEALEAKLKETKATIKALGFSVTASKQLCKKSADAPIDGSIEECVKLSAKKRVDTLKETKTVKTGWFSSKTVTFEDAQQEMESAGKPLDQLVASMIELEIKKVVLTTMMGNKKEHRVDKEQLSRMKDELKAKLKQVSKHILNMGFDYSTAFKTCKKSVAESPSGTLGSNQKILERVEAEVQDVCKKDSSGTCVEQEVDDDGNARFCPEGTSCQCQRSFNPVRGVAVGGGFLGVSWPGAVLIGTVVGGLVGGPPGAATGALIGTSIPWSWIAAVVGQMSASGYIHAKVCQCFADPCTVDEETRSCVLKAPHESKAQGNSSNPFAWLPYSGHKCAPVPKKHGETEVKCELQTCSMDDKAAPLESGSGLQSGRLGLIQEGSSGYKAVYNCALLKSDAAGARQDVLLRDSALGVPERNSLYEMVIPSSLRP